MKKEKNNKKKQDLGIYYTPEVVVDFIYDILNILKDKEDKEKKRWQSRKPQPHYPSVIDPACGEGIFLKKAVESGYTGEHPKEKVPYIWGIDIDETVVSRWEDISLLKMFHGKRRKMKDHFYHQNGLIPLKEKKLSYKKKKDGLQQFDAVVGNPPYGGLGFTFESLKKKDENKYLEYRKYFNNYKVVSYRKMASKGQDPAQQALWGTAKWGAVQWGGGGWIDDDKLIESTPIEILFLDRFIQLTKPKGIIAIIIPDGILANSTTHYVRDYISANTKVLGIVSLPRNTFSYAGTSAKTSILFLEKLRRKMSDHKYPVFLATLNKLEKKNLDIIVQNFKEFIYKRKLIVKK